MKKNMKELDKTQLEMVNGGSESEIVIDDLALVPELDEIDESEVITIRQRIPARRLPRRSRSQARNYSLCKPQQPSHSLSVI